MCEEETVKTCQIGNCPKTTLQGSKVTNVQAFILLFSNKLLFRGQFRLTHALKMLRPEI
jgi:hypothetical protein